MMTGATQPHSAPPQGAPTNAEPYVVYWTGSGRRDDAVTSKPLWDMNLANQAAGALLTYAAYRQLKGK